MKSEFYWIPGPWTGKLAIVPRPRGGDWLSDEVTEWKRAGVGTAVSLLETDEATQLGLANEQVRVEAQGLLFVSFPIQDRGIPASTQAALTLLSSIAALLESGNIVAIHCRQSVGRAGLIASGLLLTAGLTPDKAISIVTAARGVTIPETAIQLEWLTKLPAQIAPPVLQK